MMGDGKALQMGTSHELGQNFARVFDIKYLGDDGAQQLCWTTSWGVSTRMVGGLIMCHGDDAGLRLPPAIAPHQVVVLLVKDDGGAGDVARRLRDELVDAGVRVRLDDRVDTSFGRRAVDWELKGVPVRIEVGPRELAEGNVGVMRRDTGEREQVAVDKAVALATSLLAQIQTALLESARARRDARTVEVSAIPEAVEAAQDGFARIPFAALGDTGEDTLAESAITVRCIQREDGSVPDSEDEPGLIAFVARSY
jgi:prolyl-tRNA synthetase